MLKDSPRTKAGPDRHEYFNEWTVIYQACSVHKRSKIDSPWIYDNRYITILSKELKL